LGPVWDDAGTANARAFPGRFDAPGFPALWVAEQVETCIAEVSHHLQVHCIDHQPGLRVQDFLFTLLEVPIAGAFDDLRGRRASIQGLLAPTGTAHAMARRYARRACLDGWDGLIHASARHRGGTCLARFVLTGLRIPTRAIGWVQFHGTGKRLIRRPPVIQA
jgi:RES domain-containing protein